MLILNINQMKNERSLHLLRLFVFLQHIQKIVVGLLNLELILGAREHNLARVEDEGCQFGFTHLVYQPRELTSLKGIYTTNIYIVGYVILQTLVVVHLGQVDLVGQLTVGHDVGRLDRGDLYGQFGGFLDLLDKLIGLFSDVIPFGQHRGTTQHPSCP